MKTNSKKFSIKDWFEKNKLYILAFVLPILSMLIVYYLRIFSHLVTKCIFEVTVIISTHLI